MKNSILLLVIGAVLSATSIAAKHEGMGELQNHIETIAAMFLIGSAIVKELEKLTTNPVKPARD